MELDDFIELPNGVRLPAEAGRHHITPPPALNDTKQELFFLEYDYPELIVRQVALTLAPRLEREYAQNQVCEWLKNHKNTGDPRRPGYLQQLIPDLSYVNEQTWSKLSTDEKDMMYIPCVPAVVVQIMTDVDKMEELQTKVSRFIDAGTREGVIVDISDNRIWIHNQGEEPRFEDLALVEFDFWPEFTLDCVDILKKRENGVAELQNQ